jgi:O-antigen ligase
VLNKLIGFAVTFSALSIYSRVGVSYDIPSSCFLALLLGVALFVNRPQIAASISTLVLTVTLLGAIYSGAGTYASYVLLAACAFSIFFASALVGQSCVANKDLRTGLAYGLVAAALFNAFAGIFQYLGFSPLFDGLFISTSYTGRAHGNVGQSNHLATLCCAGLVVIWASIESGFKNDNLSTHIKIRQKKLCIACIWTLSLAIGLSISRTGLLQLFFLILIFLTWWKNQDEKKWFLSHLLVAYVVAQTVFPGVLFLIGENSTHMGVRVSEGSSGRFIVWGQVLDLISQRPFTGWGWREFAYARYANLNDSIGGMYFDNAHNFILQLIVELGLIRAGLVLLVSAVCLYIFKPWRQTDAPARCAWTIFLLLIIHSMLEMPLWHPKFLLLLGLSMGVMFSFIPKVNTLPPAMLRLYNLSSSPWISRGYALVLICLSFWVAKDYLWVSQPYFSKSMRFQAYALVPLDATKNAVFFVPHADFAKLILTKTTIANAREINELANRVLHFEAAPIVINPLIESYWLLGEKQEVNFHALRYERLFPSKYAESVNNWEKTSPELFEYLQKNLPIANKPS